jgi:hypothetical protein
MSKMKDVVQWRTVSGEPVTAGDITLTPQSQALTVRFPKGGFVWNRPVAVLVERDGQMERIPVVDVTRIAQVFLLGLGFVFFVVGLMLSVRNKERQK